MNTISKGTFIEKIIAILNITNHSLDSALRAKLGSQNNKLLTPVVGFLKITAFRYQNFTDKRCDLLSTTFDVDIIIFFSIKLFCMDQLGISILLRGNVIRATSFP